LLRPGAGDDVALIGAAIAATEKARTRGAAAPAAAATDGSRWREAARREALRG
jgi:hypothetical protein